MKMMKTEIGTFPNAQSLLIELRKRVNSLKDPENPWCMKNNNIWIELQLFFTRNTQARNIINKFFGENKPKGSNVTADYVLEYIQD